MAEMPARGGSPLISIVIPVYNEELNVRLAYDAVRRVFDGLGGKYRYEIVFTDNHSTDRTFEILTELAARDPAVRVARFARNFGINRSLLTGYRIARGDAAIQLDCDLQDPPELIPSFLEKWQQGHDVVVGVRRKREESRLLELTRKAFYRLLNHFSDEPVTIDGGEFRLIDRSILDQLAAVDDAQPFVRALVSSLAARQTGMPYDRDRRQHGESKFPVHKLIQLALEGFFAHTVIPLRIATATGLVIAFLALLLSGYYLLARLLFGADWPSGFATVSILLLFGISLNAVFLGVIGEYVGRIYMQVRRRPTSVIEASLNVSEAELAARRRLS